MGKRKYPSDTATGKESDECFDLIAMGRSSIDLFADFGVPFVDIKRFEAYVGGTPTNTAVGARRLGIKTALFTALGIDPIGDFILDFLSREGVETKFIPRKQGTRSCIALLGIEPQGILPHLLYRDNAPDTQLTIDDVKRCPIAHCKVLELTGTGLNKEPSRSATSFAARQARKGGTKVILDLDFRADQWDDPRDYGESIRSILRSVHIAVGTEEEIKATAIQDVDQIKISNSQFSCPTVIGDLDSAVDELLSHSLEALVVKRGIRGSVVHLSNGEKLEVPAFPVNENNPIGAGDAFAAGFIYGHLKGWDWYKCARMGNACAAIVVTKHGVANFMPSESEVFKFIDKY